MAPCWSAVSGAHTRSRVWQVYSSSQLNSVPVIPHCCLNLRPPSTQLNLKKSKSKNLQNQTQSEKERRNTQSRNQHGSARTPGA